VDAHLGQALLALSVQASDSQALKHIMGAVHSLVRGMRTQSALEAIDALVSVCTEIDEANLLLKRGGLGMVTGGARLLHTPRLEVTWLAP